MNDLLSRSYKDQSSSPPNNHPHVVIEMSSANTTGEEVNLDRFFEDVEAIKDALQEMESLFTQLQASHEQSKALHSAKAVKDLRSRMQSNVTATLNKAKSVKVLLEALDRSNAANRTLPGCGPGSSSDRTRTSIVNGLRKKLQDVMNRFNELRQKIGSEYRETIQRRYYTVTGENPDEKTLDGLIETGESETFLQKAIQQQGRGQVMDTVVEIQERHDAVRDLERNLNELHQVFLDMAVLVQSQGQELDDIESHVNRANSYVRGGTSQLEVARRHQKNTRKWTCFGLLLLLIIALIVVLPIVLRN